MDQAQKMATAQAPIQFQLSEEQSQKLTTWKNEPSVRALKEDLETSKQSHDSHMLRVQGWNDLMAVKGTAKPAKVKGRSSVQPKLIRRQAEWRYSALSEPFLSSKKLYNVSPVTFEDAKAATQNELVINWQFRTKLNRVKFVDDFVRSVVDEGTGIVQVGWVRDTIIVQTEVPVYQHYAIEQQEQLEPFQQALQLREDDPHSYDEKVDPLVKAAIDYYDESGQPTIAVQSGTQKVPIEKVLVNKPTAEVLNPQNFYLDPSCNGDIDKALFAVVSFETNKAELTKNKKRYKNLDRVNWEANTPLTQPEHSTQTPDTFQFKDAVRKRVVAYEYWGFYDINGDGRLVPIVCTWIGDTIIRMEENPFPDQKLPFVLVPYLPVKRELYGEPDAELLEDNQKILGALSRGMIDLLGRSANGQQGFAKGMLDPLNRRRFENGQDYEFNPNMPPAQGHFEHKYPEVPQSALLMSNIQNQEAESLTGVKAFSGGLSGDSYGDVAAGVRGALDAASKREMSILRRVAKGFIDIGSKIVSMNQIFLSKEEVIRVTNTDFQTVKREDLQGNFDLDTDISTAEVDNQKAQDLAFMLQTIGNTMDMSITLMILAEIADLKRMPELAEKLRKFQPTPTPEQQQMQALQLEKAKLEVEEIKSQIALNNAKAAESGAIKDKTNLDYLEQETGTKHAREMQRQGAQGRANQDLQVTKALTTPTKEGDKRPDIEAAIGYNELSDRMNKAGQPEADPVDIAPQLGGTPVPPEMQPEMTPSPQF